jgi:DNA-binding response OmpR family regulator
MSDEPPTVLVVEDERDLADLYATWLQDSYRVRIANGGREALEKVDDEVKVALLDRRMPDLSGDEVLDAIRERGIDCRVAMVTAVEPDFDVVDMGFDDYLVKPVSREDLEQVVSNLLIRAEYDEGIQRLFSLTSKKALLESEKDPAVLGDVDEYQDLLDDIDTLRAELDEKISKLNDTDDLARVYQDLSRE